MVGVWIAYSDSSSFIMLYVICVLMWVGEWVGKHFVFNEIGWIGVNFQTVCQIHNCFDSLTRLPRETWLTSSVGVSIKPARSLNWLGQMCLKDSRLQDKCHHRCYVHCTLNFCLVRKFLLNKLNCSARVEKFHFRWPSSILRASSVTIYLILYNKLL